MSKKQDAFEDVDFPTDIRREIHEHEVYMSFNGDDDATNFREWWDDAGAAAFLAWLGKRGAK